MIQKGRACGVLEWSSEMPDTRMPERYGETKMCAASISVLHTVWSRYKGTNRITFAPLQDERLRWLCCKSWSCHLSTPPLMPLS